MRDFQSIYRRWIGIILCVYECSDVSGKNDDLSPGDLRGSVDCYNTRFSAEMVSRAEAPTDFRLCVRARFKRRKDASYDFVNPFSNAS